MNKVEINGSNNKSDTSYIIDKSDLILVTGATGFIGSRLVYKLLKKGFTNIRCFSRHTSDDRHLNQLKDQFPGRKIQIIKGNLISKEDCRQATNGVSIVYHLAAGVDKSYAGCYLNSVVATRNIVENLENKDYLKRFINISSIAVYNTRKSKKNDPINEKTLIDTNIVKRFEPYVYSKYFQDILVKAYSDLYGFPYVIIRPGVVFGPGKPSISGRVGIDTFGIFLQIGSKNHIPFTYIDNCVEAIILAGLIPGIDFEHFNIVDDDLPTGRQFLKLYKKNVSSFLSLPVPNFLFLVFCYLWERYSYYSGGQIPPVFNVARCKTYWKDNTYSNTKAKRLLGWRPEVDISQALNRYFTSIDKKG